MWKCLKLEFLFVENQNKPGLKRSPLLHVISPSMGKEGGRDKVNVQFAFIVHFGRADICGPILFGNLEAIMPDYVPQHFLLFTVSWTLTLPLFAALKRGEKTTTTWSEQGGNQQNLDNWCRTFQNHFSGKISLRSQTRAFLLHFTLFIIRLFCCESVSEIKLQANAVCHNRGSPNTNTFNLTGVLHRLNVVKVRLGIADCWGVKQEVSLWRLLIISSENTFEDSQRRF